MFVIYLNSQNFKKQNLNKDFHYLLLYTINLEVQVNFSYKAIYM
jgi:hypothetical protein